MATSKQRVQITLDDSTSNMLSLLADRKHKSISATALELINKALELDEDLYLSEIADKNLQNTKKWHNHEEAWS